MKTFAKAFVSQAFVSLTMIAAAVSAFAFGGWVFATFGSGPAVYATIFGVGALVAAGVAGLIAVREERR